MPPATPHDDTMRAILFFLSEGLTPARILREHPQLTIDDIRAAAAEALRTLEMGESREARVARVRRAHPRAFEPWTAKEDVDLRFEHGAGAGVAALARAFGRPPGAIRMRLQKLGALPARPGAPPTHK